jgi:hypothetical protein
MPVDRERRNQMPEADADREEVEHRLEEPGHDDDPGVPVDHQASGDKYVAPPTA